jgi:hypothetical protein
MKIATISILLAVTALSACSGIPRRESDQQVLSRYTAYAGEPVREFRTYSHFDSWSAVDNHHVFVETNVNDAYLVTVVGPCVELPYANRIAFTSRFPHTVSSGFDSIRVGRDVCRISEIRPVDYRKLKEDMRAERADAAKEDKNRG